MSKGNPAVAAQLYQYMSERRRLPAPPAWPTGISTDAGDDPLRAMAVRIAGVAVARGAAMDAGFANVYDIIRWFPETDGKARPK